jgi:hypothetical protein
MAYTEPTPADLKTRYPAFADVADATVQVYLDDTVTSVDGSWREADYIPAKAALAAHNMALASIGVRSEVDGYAAAGVNRIRSGQVDISISDAKAARASGGGLDATVYGQAYKRILKRNKGGPRLAGGIARVDGWGPTAQLNNGGVLPWAS